MYWIECVIRLDDKLKTSFIVHVVWYSDVCYLYEWWWWQWGQTSFGSTGILIWHLSLNTWSLIHMQCLSCYNSGCLLFSGSPWQWATSSTQRPYTQAVSLTTHVPIKTTLPMRQLKTRQSSHVMALGFLVFPLCWRLTKLGQRNLHLGQTSLKYFRQFRCFLNNWQKKELGIGQSWRWQYCPFNLLCPPQLIYM